MSWPQTEKALIAADIPATITLGSQVGEVWSGVQTIPIADWIDRHHKYVHWGPRAVFFKNAGTHDEWQTSRRQSRIHRTAVAARCRELRRSRLSRAFEYFDALPFPSNDLNRHRGPLCEYCFFGGPEKLTALPAEDWF